MLTLTDLICAAGMFAAAAWIIAAERRSIVVIGTRELDNMPQGGGGYCEGYQPCENTARYGDLTPEQKAELHRGYLRSRENIITFGEMNPEQKENFYAHTD